MATQTLPAAPTELADAPLAALIRLRLHPIVPGLTSAILLGLAFPGQEADGWGWLAWIALAPVFSLVHSQQRRRSVYFGAWVGGLAFWLSAIRWVTWSHETAWLAWVVMALVLSLWWVAFLALARLAVRRLGVPLMVAAPVIWVALEFVQGYTFTGFPWYYLAHTQYRALPLIQIADLAGAWGVSFLLAMANAWWVDLATLPLLRPTPDGPRPTRTQVARLVVLATALLATLGYGAYRMATAQFRDGPRVALLQSDLKQEFKMVVDPQKIQLRYEQLVEKALRQRPDLIVWPESSWPFHMVSIDPKLPEAELERQAKARDPEESARFWRERSRIISGYLHDWVDRTRTPMVMGTLTYDFSRAGFSRYNSAALLSPGTLAVPSYHKIHLVPFGEYVPLLGTLPWLIHLTPYRIESAPSLAFGSKPVGFDLKGVRYATVICFEDTVPRVTRRFFAEAAGRQPDVLLNLSNDGWFRGSSEPDMHLAISVFRAVENRVPLARAANTGISALIDGDGRILQVLQKLEEDVLTVRVPLDDRVSLYSSWGDWLARGCLVVSVGLTLRALAGAMGDRRRIRQSARFAQTP